ncbi:TPA: recombination mediator protein UvsY [Salmonella enterica]
MSRYATNLTLIRKGLIDAHASGELKPLDTKIAYYQMILDFASRALDIIKARGFSIKNAIELRSLESGR